MNHNNSVEQKESVGESQFRFSILQLIYIIAWVAAALALFEEYAPYWFIGVCLFWSLVYVLRLVANSMLEVFIVILCLVLFLLFLGLPSVQRVREASNRTVCLNNVRQLGLALQNYQSSRLKLPPAYITDKAGVPIHSWRALILPELEQIAAYGTYDFAKGWNDPANSQVLKLVDSNAPFFCPLQNKQSFDFKTPYKLVTGDGTAFESDIALNSAQITSPSNTIAIIEDLAHPVCWMEPKDLSIKEAVRLFDINHVKLPKHVIETKFSRRVYYHRTVALLDGSALSVGCLKEPQQIVPYFTLSHPDKQNLYDLDFIYPEPTYEVRYLGYILLGLNLFFAILPCFWRKLQPFESSHLNYSTE